MAAPMKVHFSIRLVIGLAFAGLLLNAADARAQAPEVTNVTPSRGPTGGGTAVLISGSRFTGATQVLFGSTSAPSFSVQNDTTILATTPPGAAGLVSVSVVTPDGTGTLEEAFGYGPIPVAVPDSYSTPFDTVLLVDPPGVLVNDDPNQGGGVVIEVGTGVTSGTLTVTPDGGFTYTPNAGFVGEDRFTYRSRNATGFSNYATVTITVGAPTSPLPPSGLYVSDQRGNRVTLRWTPAGVGPAPTGFAIEGGIIPGQTVGSILTGPAPIFTFELAPGTYYVRVHTLVGDQRSGPSNEIQLFVNVPVPPAAPENFIGGVNGDTVTLAWRNSFSQGEPTSLVLDVSGAVSTSIQLGRTDQVSFSGVPAGTYTLSLRAINSTGSSAPAEPVTLTVPGTCTSAPATPTRFLAYRSGSSIHVIWDPPATGEVPTGYVLNVSGSFIGSFATTARAMSGTVGPGSYTLSVIALNPCGASSATAPQTVVVP